MQRITDPATGARIYQTPDGNFPSVTTILSATDKPANVSRLKNWNANNPGALEAAQHRGTMTHAAIERWLAGYTNLTPEEIGYADYIENAKQAVEKTGLLKSSSALIWSEKPVIDVIGSCDKHHFIGSDGHARVWSAKHGFAGSPDIIGIINNEYRIIDIKTSDTDYWPCYPDKKLCVDESGEFDEKLYLSRFRGWQKYQKCCLQMAAYSIAFEELTGLVVSRVIVASASRRMYNVNTLHHSDIERYKDRFLQKLSQYYDQLAKDNDHHVGTVV